MKFVVVVSLWVCSFELIFAVQIRTAGCVIRGSIFGRATLPITDICKSSTDVGKKYCDGATICKSTAVLSCTTSTGGYTILTCPPEKPYCVSSALDAECVETPPAECAGFVPPFQCTSTGIGNYPDLSKCKMYYNCHKDTNSDIRQEAIICPPGYVLDSNSASKQFCLYSSSPSKCVTVTGCDGATTTKNIAITNNALFVVLSQPLIFQCPTGTKANLDKIPVSCTFICKLQGQFEYTPDKNYYYDCRVDSTKKIYSEQKPCRAYQGPFIKYLSEEAGKGIA